MNRKVKNREEADEESEQVELRSEHGADVADGADAVDGDDKVVVAAGEALAGGGRGV